MSGKIGDVTVCEVKVYVCLECGEAIDYTDLCGYHCRMDGLDKSLRPAGSVVVKVYKRTDELIREEPYVP